jgi:hypothetical protein
MHLPDIRQTPGPLTNQEQPATAQIRRECHSSGPRRSCAVQKTGSGDAVVGVDLGPARDAGLATGRGKRAARGEAARDAGIKLTVEVSGLLGKSTRAMLEALIGEQRDPGVPTELAQAAAARRLCRPGSCPRRVDGLVPPGVIGGDEELLLLSASRGVATRIGVYSRFCWRPISASTVPFQPYVRVSEKIRSPAARAGTPIRSRMGWLTHGRR